MASYSLPTGAGCTNKTPSGISNIISDLTSGVTDYTVTLSHLLGGSVESETVEVDDQYGRNRALGKIWRIKGVSPEIPGTVANLEKLVEFSTCVHYPFAQSIEASSPREFHLGNATVGSAGSPKWKLIISGNVKEKRVVEFEWQRWVSPTSATASVIDEPIVFTTAASAGNTGLFAATTGASAGFRTIEVRQVGETNYETLDITKGRLECELVTLPPEEDQESRHQHTHQVSVMGEFEATATTAAALAAITTLSESTSNDMKITCQDGMIFTFTDNLGISCNFTLPYNAGSIPTTKITVKGTMLLSGWAGFVS